MTPQERQLKTALTSVRPFVPRVQAIIDSQGAAPAVLLALQKLLDGLTDLEKALPE